MSHLGNEQRDPSSSPSRSDPTSIPTVENNQRRRNPEDPIITGQGRVPAGVRSISGNTAPQNRGYPLHEFHSLLEAAQRIANSAPFDTEGHRWREDDQPEPIIYLNRGRAGEPPRRRVPLTRQYSGRPHVPGEDSGSEGGMDDVELESERDIDRQRENQNASSATQDQMEGISDTSTSTNLDQASSRRSYGDDPFQTGTGIGRTRDRQPEEEERDLFEQALARSRAVRSRFEAEARRPIVTENQRSRYSTTAPSPTQESFYDWAPEPSQPRHPDSNHTWRPRSRAASIRRWRPAERLQDYASSNARRDSTGSNQTLQLSGDQSIPRVVEGVHPSRTNTNMGSHEDVVDRVERALQQYRIARSALRVPNDDSTGRAILSPNPAPLVSLRAIGDGSPSNYPRTHESPTATQLLTNSLDNTRDPDPDGRVVPSAFGIGDIANGSTMTRSASAARERREEPIRQRIREQVRERRRRVLRSFEQEQALAYARGPLFEGSGSVLSNRAQLDTRRMLEKIRNEEARERSLELKRAKAALQYLARLRESDMDEVKAWTIAAGLGLHNQSLEEDSKTNLALSLEGLQKPSYSSWLEPGMTWIGIQDANDADGTPARPHRPSTHEISTARDRSDRTNSASPQHESFRTRLGATRDRLERTLLGDSNPDPLTVARNSMQVLEDAERSLSSMLERSEELLRENERQLRDNENQLRQNRERLRETDQRLMLLDEAVRHRAESRSRHDEAHSDATQPSSRMENDRWNVKVSLHSIDAEQMTVSGTMTASHNPNIPLLNQSYDAGQELAIDTSMDSFFTGDIVDFVHHGLDTASQKQPEGQRNTTNVQYRRQQDEWRVGGPEVDLSYWAGIGPFKREVDRALRNKERQNGLARAMQLDETDSDMQLDSNAHPSVIDLVTETTSDGIDKVTTASDRRSHYTTSPLSNDEKFAVKMDTMARLLCDTTWLNENTGAGGWILMRWKERCFVSPGTDPNPDVRRPWIPNQSRGGNQSGGTPTGGFSNIYDSYSQDMFRRRRERDTRVWSTNAAEREELAMPENSTTPLATITESGTRQPTWGLTISGFYYVALERKTGNIEALYYDYGSTPFQKLKMSPQTLYSRSLKSSTGDGTGNAATAPPKMDLDLEANTGQTEQVDLSDIKGLKTNFNIIEFR